jgi:hypothetical protein
MCAGGSKGAGWPVLSTASLPAGPAAMAHHGQEGFSLPGAFPEGSSMRIEPCEVQITICASAAASVTERWASVRERTKGCAATVRATASSRNVRKPALILRMQHCWDFPAAKAMPPGPQLVELEALIRPWSTGAGLLCNEAATAAGDGDLKFEHACGTRP